MTVVWLIKKFPVKFDYLNKARSAFVNRAPQLLLYHIQARCCEASDDWQTLPYRSTRSSQGTTTHLVPSDSTGSLPRTSAELARVPPSSPHSPGAPWRGRRCGHVIHAVSANESRPQDWTTHKRTRKYHIYTGSIK